MPEKPRPRPGVGGSAGRVIAGVARGRRLVAPGAGTRPLGDRVKQSLFAIIEPEVRDGAVLDLFAGSGAAGIEALSRGARAVVFVEHSANVGQYIERNLRTASLHGPQARIVRADVVSWLRDAAGGAGGAAAETMPFDAIVLDPPYDEPHLVDRSLEGIAAAGPDGILAADGVAVAKHGRRVSPEARYGLLRSAREARFGETTLTFYRWSAPDEGEEVQ
jgi:16S rRNA (guanine966-N2)-methyltransferase